MLRILKRRKGSGSPTGNKPAVLAIAGMLPLVFTGFYLVLSTSWNVFYKLSILIHPLLGIFCVLYFPHNYLTILKRDFESFPVKRMLYPIILGIFVIIQPDQFLRLLPRVIYGFEVFSGIVVFVVTRAALRGISREKWCGFIKMQALFYTWLVVAMSGIMILLHLKHNNINVYYTQHRWWSVMFLAALLLHFAGLEKAPGPDGRWRLKPLPEMKYALIMLFFLAIIFAVDMNVRHNETAFKLQLSTIILSRRSAEERNVSPAFKISPQAYDIVDSCGDGNVCHRQVVKEFLVSNHNRTYQPAYFKKNLDEMSREVGRENAVICAGCHTPYGVFNPKAGYEHFTNNNAFSCTFCHLVNGAGVDQTDKRKSWYSMAYPKGHLKIFLDRDGRPIAKLDGTHRLLISLNRVQHQRIFKRQLYNTDAFCQACHHLQIKALNPHASNLEKPKCINCHMQSGDMLGTGDSRRNHFMPGANAHVPMLLGDKDSAEIVRKFAAGYLGIDLPLSWKNLWGVRYKESDLPAKNPWLTIFFENITRPVEGETWRFKIHTYNTGMGHAFPAAPLDLVQAWLEVEAHDKDGRLLFASGGLDKSFQLLEGTHTLGGYMIGEDNHLVTRNRVWQIKEKVVERVIPYGDKTEDEFSFVLPSGAKGVVSVTARWRYRKMNQNFMDWAYGPEIKTAPPVIAGEMTWPLTVK